MSQPQSPLPSGVGVALVTFFDDDGIPDVATTVARARACVERGVSSVLVAGTTGEAWRLTPGHRIALAAALSDALPEIPIVVGTGDPSASRALATTTEVAEAAIADALLVLSAGDLAPFDFYAAVRRAAPGVPVLAYHNPAVSAPGIETSKVPDLPVEGIKDSSGSTNRLAELVERGVAVYVGSPTMLALAGACGARGALLALANVFPSQCIAAWNGDMTAQRRLWAVHQRVGEDVPGFLRSSEPA